MQNKTTNRTCNGLSFLIFSVNLATKELENNKQNMDPELNELK